MSAADLPEEIVLFLSAPLLAVEPSPRDEHEHEHEHDLLFLFFEAAEARGGEEPVPVKIVGRELFLLGVPSPRAFLSNVIVLG